MNTEILNKFVDNRVTLHCWQCNDLVKTGMLERISDQCYRVKNALGHVDFNSDNADSAIIDKNGKINVNVAKIGE